MVIVLQSTRQKIQNIKKGAGQGEENGVGRQGTTVEKLNLRIREWGRMINDNLKEKFLEVRHRFAHTQNHTHKYLTLMFWIQNYLPVDRLMKQHMRKKIKEKPIYPTEPI